MNSSAQQTLPADKKLADAGVGSSKPSKHQPLIIAGTTEGLLILNRKQDFELKGNSITALASGAEGLWAIVDRTSVWQRHSNHNWQQLVEVDDLRLNCILPIEGAVLVGTSGACLLRITDKNTTRLNCFESVAGRDEWYTPWGGPPDVRSLAMSQSGDLYVNVHVGGILRSQNQGQTWHPTIDVDADVHEVRTVANDPKIVLAATAQGLAISSDNGNSWHFDRTHLHAAYARAVAVCRETVLLTASTGPHSSKAAIYRRSLRQDGFEKCQQGLPEWFTDNINTGTLATLGNVAAFGTRDGQVFLSRDCGLTWQQTANNLASIQCLQLISAPASEAEP